MRKIFRLSGSIIACFFGFQNLTGCANDEKFDPEYGYAVHNMITVQTSSPGKSSFGMDGEKALLTLKKYETDVSDPKSVKTITISQTASEAGSIGNK